MAQWIDTLDTYGEGMSILDYGCGAGIFFNFLSARLKNFTYKGVEPNTKFGQNRIALAKKSFGHDSRAEFGFIEKDLKKWLHEVDSVVAISVYTHLEPAASIASIDNVMTQGNNIEFTFSIFNRKVSHVVSSQPAYGPGYHGMSYWTIEWVENYSNSKGFTLTHESDFKAAGGHIHNIFKLTAL